MNTSKYNELSKIVGPDRVSDNQELLQQYRNTHRPDEAELPSMVVWPFSAEEISHIVNLANKMHFPLVPISSGPPRMSGSCAPKVKGTVILDLSKMKRIIRVDSKNKVVMIEPGVTYAQLLPELRKAGLRPLMPLLPKASQSVLASCLDREPTVIPRFHWDASDPLLCTETIFGTGEILRTGSAAGPGSLEEQWKSGQAQKNPMGPSQFDPFRLVQGSQGTIGIVTWITMKCEVAPDVRRVFLVGSDSLESLQKFNHAIIRRRLVDEHFAVNSRCLAEMLGKDIGNSLPEWILVLGLSGHGPLAEDEFDYRLTDTRDIAAQLGVKLEAKIGEIDADDISGLLNAPSIEPYWKVKSFGGCKEVYFISTLDRIPELHSIFMNEAEKSGIARSRIGVYVQPVVQGVNVHCCFDIYYDPQDESDVRNAKILYFSGSKKLMESGAFFSRPPDALRDVVYSQVSPEILGAMNRVKSIFDPNNVLSPGNLCF
ncbi:MAG: FAD-binding oxidoreductase [Candidatus Thorarchaeota archaeon]|nr:FAD-binding oxidoreductase [Candidatus Thorarchaeota archaeon]